MKQIDKRLIVSDFDGTLLTSRQDITENVRAAIEEYVAYGGIFAICTGRMLRSILPRARELGLKGLVVAYQGTVIAEIESGRIIKNGGISYGDTARICRYIEKINSVNVYSDEKMYTTIPEGDGYLARYERITGVQAEHINGSAAEFVTQNKLTCQKITCLVAPDKREQLFKNLKDEFGSEFDVTCSAEVLVEMSPLGDNKGEALRYIANYYGIPMDSTVAAGDNLNDLSMIEAASVGVAVGNAVPALKQAADYVSASNDDGAIAQVIFKYGFKEDI